MECSYSLLENNHTSTKMNLIYRKIHTYSPPTKKINRVDMKNE